MQVSNRDSVKRFAGVVDTSVDHAALDNRNDIIVAYSFICA